ncbi:MAG: hypoxanthine phosphoribosyltransferase, partial [Armatimonadetes bacterium]|nr:hypoxanthine phosphoribosyltransferase [Armatimonadota bacterium]
MGVGGSRVQSLPLPRPLIAADDIQRRVGEIGAAISRDYDGRSVLAIGILTGAVVFMSDLIRHICVPTEIDFMAVSSYGSGTSSTGQVRILKDVATPVQGRHVLVVEDIVDTGLTLRRLCRIVESRGPASLATCALLDKPSRRTTDVRVDYSGFTIPDTFVVGYGLDSAGYYRNLNY